MITVTPASGSSLVIVANRLAVHRVRRRGRDAWFGSPGGLVSCVRPVMDSRDCTWIGWTGDIGGAGGTVAPFDFGDIHNVPVTLKSAEYKAYYEGFCNGTIWPLYHDAIRPPEFRREWWNAYVQVNRRYADLAADHTAPNAVVWIHDYHLQLVPALLRERRADCRIGFFLHIPFPPQELFGQLPWRRELLTGMLGADLVGFQTLVGASNFAQVCRRYAGAAGEDNLLRFDDRLIRVGAFPVSIDVHHHEALATDPRVAQRREEYRVRIGQARKVMLGVDRLDYTKGIDIRLEAFRELLKSGRVSRNACVLLQVAVPSREHVADYKQLRLKVERLVGEINGEFSEIGRTPVQYLHRSLNDVDLAALYTMADVMVVTPLRDGMNLVCKEYVASRMEDTGVLILSEFTGAAKELETALHVNPHDVDGVAEAMAAALVMSPEEQANRMQAMRTVIRANDVHRWANTYLEALDHARVG